MHILACILQHIMTEYECKNELQEDLSIVKLNKSKNGENADKEEEYIVAQLNNHNTINFIAKKICENFTKKYPDLYLTQSHPHFVKLGGRQNSIDVRETKSGETIELKKVSKIKKNKPLNPLIVIPQFAQINKGGLRDYYVEEWYKFMLPEIKRKLDIQADIPDFQSWVKYDAGQGDKKNTTDFTKELEEKHKGKLSDIKNTFVEYLKKQIRKDPIKYQKMVYEDFKTIAREVLNKKDNWCIYGNVDGVTCHLYNKIEFPEDLTHNDFLLDDKKKNISFKILHESGLFRETMICWKNGNGIRNIAFKCI